jgi:hypothetical protein
VASFNLGNIAAGDFGRIAQVQGTVSGAVFTAREVEFEDD